jgi:hypothetical protein
MTDEQTPASGNRWEPTGAEPAVAETTETAATAVPGPTERRSLRGRVRPAVAASVAGAAVVAGLGGFAVGRATADGGGSGDQQQVGFFPGDGDGHGDGDHHGFDQDGDGGGFPGGPGGGQQLPPPGQEQGQDQDQQQTEPGPTT